MIQRFSADQKMYETGAEAETRLVNLKGWPEALKEGEKWAWKNGMGLRIAQIGLELAQRLFKGVKVEN